MCRFISDDSWVKTETLNRTAGYCGLHFDRSHALRGMVVQDAPASGSRVVASCENLAQSADDGVPTLSVGTINTINTINI